MSRQGLLVVISGPSGAGKGTLFKLVRSANENIQFSVSATTRKPREGEQNGVNYFFKTADEFQRMLKDDELLEWVEYCDNYYGTPRQYVDECLKAGYDMVLEIEVEGAQKIKKKYPECVSIFILPPSFKELRKRIEGRGTEKPEIVEKRLMKARKEIDFVESYDYVVINDIAEEAAKKIGHILSSEKLRIERNRDVLTRIEMT